MMRIVLSFQRRYSELEKMLNAFLELSLEQVVVADGEKLWIYDPGLEQAVLRNQDSALGDTPAGLLAGDTSPRDSYLVESLGNQGGIDWVSVFPKEADAAFSQSLVVATSYATLGIDAVANAAQETNAVTIMCNRHKVQAAAACDWGILLVGHRIC